MKGLLSPSKKIAVSGVYSFILYIVISISFFVANVQAQRNEKRVAPMNVLGAIATNNQFIWANVDGQSGRVNVLLPPGRSFDPSLDFPDHSYFTCSISGTYFTNNDVIQNPPANVKQLTDGVTTKIADTIRTIWYNKNNVDIIQDIYPVAFTKSGQIVYKWSFKNNSPGTPVSVACQYLQDIQISDPGSKQAPNSTDGPTILTKWSYKNLWQQFPNPSTPSQTLPWFYIGFLYTLPNNPSLNPGLSGMGYMDYGAPLNLIKPFRMTIGDWPTMTNTIFGQGAWPFGTSYGTPPQQVDDAILIEFPAQGVGAGKTVTVGKTSYGTGEYEKCVGSLFSIDFYPHHLVWTKQGASGFYTPNPVHVEKFAVNPDKINSSANTKIKLTVGDDMNITDITGIPNLGKSQIQPTSGNGVFLGPGDVGYFDWWAWANPALFCTGADVDSLIYTASCGVCPPGFLNEVGMQECDQLITIDCAEADLDAPIDSIYSDNLPCTVKKFIDVHDDRKTDRGLQGISWHPSSKADSANQAKFNITVTPPIQPCFNDKLIHTVTIQKLDSTIGGCYDFTFIDCLGHQSNAQVCLQACPLVKNFDTLPPVFSLIKQSGSYDASLCNNRIDSFEVTELRQYDKGICKLDTIPGSVNNMILKSVPFSPGDLRVRFSVHVIDSMHDGNLCIRATDCATVPKSNYTDTCFHYCTIKDTLAPRITITKDANKAGLWNVVVRDDTAWDRHIDSVFIIKPVNVLPTFIAVNISGSPVYVFTMTSPDTTKPSSFCIEATDLAGNRSVVDAHCAFQGVGKDSLCPNIVITPPLNTNPTSISVNVNDIHFTDPPANTNKYVWDTGVDSVWFTNNTGMIVPSPISGNGAMTIPQFIISVKDTNAVDTVSCVTINVSDKKGNICSATYCYPYIPDVVAPLITLWYNPLDKSQIFGVITDSTLEDRGLDSITLIHSTPGIDTNLKFKQIQLQGAKVQVIDGSNAITRDPKRSSVGTLLALDRWGSLSHIPSVTSHIATVDFAVWVQDFAMKPGIQPNQGASFYVPVYFVKNDSFRVRRKEITDFKLTFTMTGDVNSVVFDSASQISTEMEVANWNRGNPMNRPTWGPPNSTTITVTGTMLPNGKPLASLPLETLALGTHQDSVVLLYFHALTDQSTRQVTLTVDSLILNQGRDSVYKGTTSGAFTSTARMPAPYGSVGGANIVITGACAPRLTSDNLHPSSVSLDPNRPNPFSHQTTFTYTVAEDGPVRIAIHDILGREVFRIVDQFQKQGTYTVTYDGSSLSGGTYVARLQTGGVVVSRRVAVEK